MTSTDVKHGNFIWNKLQILNLTLSVDISITMIITFVSKGCFSFV